MELKEFIKTAIEDITNAVFELQAELDNGAIIVPSMPHAISTKTIDIDGAHSLISNIDFDVALTTESKDGLSGNAKAGIQILSAKLTGSNEERIENASHMSFSIPIIYPTAHVITDTQKRDLSNRESLHRLNVGLKTRYENGKSRE